MRISNTTKIEQKHLERRYFSRLHVSSSSLAGGKKRITLTRKLLCIEDRWLWLLVASFSSLCWWVFCCDLPFHVFGCFLPLWQNHRQGSFVNNFFIRIVGKSAINLMADGNSLYEADLVMHFFSFATFARAAYDEIWLTCSLIFLR